MKITNRYSNRVLVISDRMFRTLLIGVLIYTNLWKVNADGEGSSSLSDVLTKVSVSINAIHDQQVLMNEDAFQSNRSFLRRKVESRTMLRGIDSNNPISNNLEVNELGTLIKQKKERGQSGNNADVHDESTGISLPIENSNTTCNGIVNSTQSQVITDYSQTKFFHNYDHLDDLLTGPGIEHYRSFGSKLPKNDNGVTLLDNTSSMDAVCSLRPVNYIAHFPHT